MKKTSKSLSLLIGAIVVLIGSFQSAQAAGSFVAVPANPNAINQNRFIYEAKPGETIHDTLYVKNTSTEEQSFKIYAIDGSLQDSKFITRQSREEIGSWITIKKPEITLKSNEGISIPFDLTISKNQELKSYYGGIAIENNATSDANNVQVNTRIITRVDLKVTDSPNPPEKKYPEPSFWQKINKTYLLVAVVLFLISSLGLGFAYLKEKPSKRAKPSRDD